MLPLTPGRTCVDLNQLYFEHQVLLMQADRSDLPGEQNMHERGAALIAGRIGCIQRASGAGAAEAWSASAATVGEIGA